MGNGLTSACNPRVPRARTIGCLIRAVAAARVPLLGNMPGVSDGCKVRHGCLWTNARIWQPGVLLQRGVLLAYIASMLTDNADIQSFASPLSGWGIDGCVKSWVRGASGTGDVVLEVCVWW